MVVFCSTVEKLCIAIQEKKLKFYIWLGSYEKKWEQLKLTLNDSNLKRDKEMKHRFEFELSNMIFYKFRSEGSFALKEV